MDIRRTLLWVVFSFAILMLWNNWQTHNGKPTLFGLGPHTATPAASGAAPAAGSANAPASAANATASATPVEAQPLITVSTDVLRLTFDPIGAQLVRAELLKYRTGDQTTVLFDRGNGVTYVAQSGLAGGNFPADGTLFHMTSTAREMTGDELTVVFEAESGGLKVIKTFTLKRGSYDIAVRHDLVNTSSAPLTPSLFLQLARDGSDPPDTSFFYHTYTGMAVYSDAEHFQKVPFDEIANNKASYIKQTNDGWVGVVQHYFATAWVPPQGTPRSIVIEQAPNVQPSLYVVRTTEPVGAIAPGSTSTIDANLWVGPQDQKAMAALAPGLDLVVDYGWLTIIAKPMFKLMTWLHSIVGNWGWTIVALTVLIKLVFFPLASASYRSMARMKAVAPRLQALKEKYGDDRQKLNQAMMELYRTEKINPLGGCLPMVVQIPVFFTLFRVLLGSVEMRGAPWILWIHDLGVRDPFFILPAIMMGTMFLQVRLNPTPPDPVQAKVMMFMPLVFGATMFFFPAGLVLYWCVNNTLSILQQWAITRGLQAKAAKAANR